VFNGKILVRPDAQKTNAYQNNRALLLSDDARVNSKPELEIFADDVRCTHGASIGQLDEEALFYLRSRGIPEPKAHTILRFAFANDVLEQIPDEAIREQLSARLQERFNQLS
ncbi:MAG: Fe-S cluster assembly protein SufD, partial [Calditrichaeota bacterium]